MNNVHPSDYSGPAYCSREIPFGRYHQHHGTKICPSPKQ